MAEISVDTPALPARIDERFSQYVYRTVSGLWRGKTNNIGSFTVSAGTTQTTVKDSRVTLNSHISIIGLDIDSKAGVLSIIERNGKEGTFIVAHPEADKDWHFSYAVIG